MELLDFFQPTSVEEAKNLLSKHDNCKLLAGGTDLVLGLLREEENPKLLIDLGKISVLKEITENDKEIILGSMVTFTQLKESKIVKDNFMSLFECASNMGSPQIRNKATVGGNIVNAGSAADVVPCLISLDAVLVIESVNGTRYTSCVNYFKNYSEEKVKENEVLTKVIIPKKNEINGYYKLGKRNALAIARVSAAVSVNVENNVVKSLAVGLGAVGRYPFRAVELEKRAVGENLEWLSGEDALSILENVVAESIKGRKTMPFKKEAIKGVYKEALNTAVGK